MSTRNFIFFIVGFGVLASLLFFTFKDVCSQVPKEEPQKGTHGYRTWSGPTLVSFFHTGEKICIPEGWQAIDAVKEGKGWATYRLGKTGVMILSSAFIKTPPIQFENSSYKVSILYPANITTPELLSEYEKYVKNAFERVGKIFGDNVNNPSREHTVLVTVGLGTSFAERDSVYPDPSADTTYLILNPNRPRSEELFVHAVMHVYNKERNDLISYEKNQLPIPIEEWQEVEATWAETALRTNNEWRVSRLNYLYGVHTAIQIGNFSLIKEAPFNKEDEFKKIKKNIVTDNNSSYLDEQYSHYVLAPLLMVATEGLLQKNKTGTNVEQLLTKIHTEKNLNYFDEVKKLLPQDDENHLTKWMSGEELIPHDLIFTTADYYARK